MTPEQAVNARDIQRGDFIVSRADGSPIGAMVQKAQWHPTVLVLTLLWGDGKRITGCSFGADEEFNIIRPDEDWVIEQHRRVFAAYVEQYS